MPGVNAVYNMGGYVAVVADGYWQAVQAIEMVDIKFTSNENDKLSQDSMFAQYGKALDSGKQNKLHKQGDTGKALEDSASVLEAEYTVPFLAHATMEPMNATAWVRDGICDVWAGTQNPLGTPRRNRQTSRYGSRRCDGA